VDGNLLRSKSLLMGRVNSSFMNNEKEVKGVYRLWYVLGESCE
jgi:hypothetical protein